MVDAAELFEAISHPERIKILKELKKQPSSFASLKRQLHIASSGNLDFHLKKLSQLVAVREDGLYGLTEAGEKALLSIDAVEVWSETEKRKVKTQEMPKEALFLGLLEVCTTALFLVFFLEVVQVSFSWDYLWGYVFLGGLLCVGFGSCLGLLVRWVVSWKMVLCQSALVLSMSCFLLIYLWKPAVGLPSSPAFIFLFFVAAEVVAVFVALRRGVRDFLGVEVGVGLSKLVIVGSFLCVLSGILLIGLVSANYSDATLYQFQTISVFASIFDPSVLCGLLVVVGGVLILSGSNVLGAAMSIIFGLFPPSPYAYHLYDVVLVSQSFWMAALVGSLPIIGGLLALAATWKMRG